MYLKVLESIMLDRAELFLSARARDQTAIIISSITRWRARSQSDLWDLSLASFDYESNTEPFGIKITWSETSQVRMFHQTLM